MLIVDFGDTFSVISLSKLPRFIELIYGRIHGKVRLKFLLIIEEKRATFIASSLPVCLRLEARVNQSCYLR